MVIIVKQNTVIIIERLGKRHRVLHAGGPYARIPVVDTCHHIDWHAPQSGVRVQGVHVPLTEMVLDFPQFVAYSRDRVEMVVDGLVQWQVVDPVLAVYSCENVLAVLESGVQAAMRAAVANMESGAIASAEAEIATAVMRYFADAPEKYGIAVRRFILESCGFRSADLRTRQEDALQKQLEAEEQRHRKQVEYQTNLEAAKADAERKTIELEARAREAKIEAQRRVIEAKAEAEARMIRAKAEADARRLELEAEQSSEALRYKQLVEVGASGDYLLGVLDVERVRALAGGSSLMMVPSGSTPLVDLSGTMAGIVQRRQAAKSPTRKERS